MDKQEAEKRIKKLRSEIARLRDQYHLADDPSVTDEVYDSLNRELRAIVAKFPVDVAVSIIDNLDILTASLIICWFCVEHVRGNQYASALYVKAMELKIRGSLGPVHARNVLYRRTGIWAGC